METMIEFFVEHSPVMLAVGLAVVAYSFLQAVVRVLSDYFMVKVFKKKVNGKNGNLEAAQLNRLIELSEERNEKLDCVNAMAGQVGEMHDIVCEKDGDNFPKIRVMEKKVREVWNKVIRGEA
jgi:hypothetical protein